jgi:glutamate--cysteine ligase
MMRRTCTVQANYDFSSEADALRKLSVALRLAPLTTAMFANSPFKEGAPWGGLSYRAQVWLDVDNTRAGLVPAAWAEGAHYTDYIEWALDAPMFLLKRQGRVLENTGQSFRSFLRHGFSGHRATLGDWETHLNTLFPEVRLKRTIEIRGADSQSLALTAALPALWTGILYDTQALAEAHDLAAGFTFEELSALRAHIPRLGLRAPFRGRTLLPLAERLVEIAAGGLGRRARLDRAGRDEKIHLLRLQQLIEHGQTPADALLAGLAEAGEFTPAVIERARL